jgi:hypothetical protein
VCESLLNTVLLTKLHAPRHPASFHSMFPPVYNQGVMFGQGVAGILACAGNIVVELALSGDLGVATMVYYIIAALSLAACLVSYILLLRRPFTKYWVAHAANLKSNDRSTATGTTTSTAPFSTESSALSGASAYNSQSLAELDESLPEEDTTQLLHKKQGAISVHVGDASGARSQPSFLAVSRAVWLEGASAFLVFALTFMMFPAIAPFHINYIGDVSHGFTTQWWQLVLLTAFNVFDTFGRVLPGRLVMCRRVPLLVSTIPQINL